MNRDACHNSYDERYETCHSDLFMITRAYAFYIMDAPDYAPSLIDMCVPCGTLSFPTQT